MCRRVREENCCLVVRGTLVRARVEFSTEEAALVTRQKISKIFSLDQLHQMNGVLGDTPYMKWLKSGGAEVQTYLGAGVSLEVDSLNEADAFEATLIAGLKRLKEEMAAREQSANELGQTRSYEI